MTFHNYNREETVKPFAGVGIHSFLEKKPDSNNILASFCRFARLSIPTEKEQNDGPFHSMFERVEVLEVKKPMALCVELNIDRLTVSSILK